ncbi:hypothetical protein ATANTOWER_003635 [Ataeniobius toweri]|uniref:Uncharacterized protein n=1 Tax=Ataeniobius toweri TaxID=208326 RepID=A0ABU7B5C8_9TELE|nr:hypothetical protein [Ataeniobius toweri]
MVRRYRTPAKYSTVPELNQSSCFVTSFRWWKHASPVRNHVQEQEQAPNRIGGKGPPPPVLTSTLLPHPPTLCKICYLNIEWASHFAGQLQQHPAMPLGTPAPLNKRKKPSKIITDLSHISQDGKADVK